MAVFEAASTSRRVYLWRPPGVSPKGYSNELALLRARSRDLVRNNDIAAAAVDTWVSNLIGSGINPHWNIQDKGLKDEISSLWKFWVRECDFDERLDFYGLQCLIAREVIEAGECFVYLKRKTDSSLAVPLQLQVLEAEFVDENYNESGDVLIVNGIEFNTRGKRQAYHIFKEHPYDMNSTRERIRVAADRICHIYRVLRAGQVRGIPWLTTVMMALKELNEYQDAELVRKKTAAMFGGFIIEGSGVPNLGSEVPGFEPEVVQLEPGTFPVLPPGSDVKLVNPSDVGNNYINWYKTQACRIARGIGLSYEQLTGDLSGVNYSSIRAGVLEFRRQCTQLQLNIFVHQFCHRIAVEWMDTAVMSGRLNIPDYWDNRRKYLDITWYPDGWDWVDPLKDINAEIRAIRAGLKSRRRALSLKGVDVNQIDLEQKEDLERARGLGLVYESVYKDVLEGGGKNDGF